MGTLCVCVMCVCVMCVCVCGWRFMGALLHVWCPAGEHATHSHTGTHTVFSCGYLDLVIESSMGTETHTQTQRHTHTQTHTYQLDSKGD